MRTWTKVLAAAALAGAGGCGGAHDVGEATREPAAPVGTEMVVQSAPRPAFLSLPGTAEPVREATLSTRLMGTVMDVAVQEGDVVVRGQPLVRIDARDLAARELQLQASLAEAEAIYREAEVHAQRMRALFAEDAAPRAQLDAAETALARATAGVNSARAAGAELDAAREYSVVRAPFNGVVTARLVDPGSFASPGVPLLVVQDVSSLRISAAAAPAAATALAVGMRVPAVIEGVVVEATVEGAVPSASHGGSTYLVNAIVANPGHTLPARGAATLSIPAGQHSVVVLPAGALVRRQDLTGVWVRGGDRASLRWIRTRDAGPDSVEVLSGLQDGEIVIVPGGR